jgi:hypothetical protein
LLSPERDDPIFIGMNRLVAKRLEEDESKNDPCPVVNRFACPYEYAKESVSEKKFDVDDLFELANMAFTVEIRSIV